ncbi:Transcription factor mbp1 [Exophiala xenobiotica]|nr:Transcription factor mbp1 [Exophiala xenobiotica]
MEGLYGLPRDTRRKKLKQFEEIKRQAFGWCQLIIDAAEDWESDPMIDFLRGYTGSRTPRAQPNRKIGAIDTEDASTIKEPFRPTTPTPIRDTGHASRSQAPFPLCTSERGQVEQWIEDDKGLAQDENASPFPEANSEDRAAKRRRRTNDFDPSVVVPGSVWPLNSDLLRQTTSNDGPGGSVDGKEYHKRRSMSDRASNEEEGRPKLPLVQAPLERREEFVSQCGTIHQAFLRLSDGRVNFTEDTSTAGPCIDIQTAQVLCEVVNNEKMFRPFLSFGKKLHDQITKTPHAAQKRTSQAGRGFTTLNFKGHLVLVRDADSWINATQILHAAGFDRPPLSWQNQNFEYDRMPHLGVFVEVDTATELCRLYGLRELRPILRDNIAANRPNLTLVCSTVPAAQVRSAQLW